MASSIGPRPSGRLLTALISDFSAIGQSLVGRAVGEKRGCERDEESEETPEMSGGNVITTTTTLLSREVNIIGWVQIIITGWLQIKISYLNPKRINNSTIPFELYSYFLCYHKIGYKESFPSRGKHSRWDCPYSSVQSIFFAFLLNVKSRP